jgi:hypothetical protein
MDAKDARIQRETAQRTAKREPLVWSCFNCEHFDGDVFCSLPTPDKLIHGCIRESELVVCARHEAKGRG